MSKLYARAGQSNIPPSASQFSALRTLQAPWRLLTPAFGATEHRGTVGDKRAWLCANRTLFPKQAASHCLLTPASGHGIRSDRLQYLKRAFGKPPSLRVPALGGQDPGLTEQVAGAQEASTSWTTLARGCRGRAGRALRHERGKRCFIYFSHAHAHTHTHIHTHAHRQERFSRSRLQSALTAAIPACRPELNVPLAEAPLCEG